MTASILGWMCIRQRSLSPFGIRAVTAQVRASGHFSGNPASQDLASQNLPTSFLTRNNFRSARQSGASAITSYKPTYQDLSESLPSWRLHARR
jgi:hypothetical protein